MDRLVKIGIFLVGIAIVGYFLFTLASSKSGVSQGIAIPTSSMASQASSGTAGSLSQAAPTDVKDRTIIKNGSISLVVKDIQQIVAQIKQAADNNGGYIVNSQISNNTQQAPTATISLRVPAEKLDATMSALRVLGVRVTAENVSADDVTDQFIDLQARLKNLQVTEAELQRLVERSANVSDTLQVYNQLTSIRGQIESMQGQITYLSQSAKLSLITVNLTAQSDINPSSITIGSWQPVEAFKVAGLTLLQFLMRLSYLLIWVLVFAPLWVATLLLIYYLKRRSKNRTSPLA